MDVINMAEEVMDLVNKKIKKLNTLNIIIAGKTGVGKSTLINAVFKDNLAQEGLGKPVTRHMRKIEKKGSPLAIYDTRGFELGKDVQDEVKCEILATIDKGYESDDINQMIHCILYCINTLTNRVEPEEIEWLKDLSQSNKYSKVPIIVVLTQTLSKDNAKKLKDVILDENLDIVQVVPVLAKDYVIDNVGAVPSFGLDSLVRVISQAIPDEVEEALNHMQIVALDEKKKAAYKAVSAAVLAATGAGAAPIPFADAGVLIPTQVTMIASITVIFGFEINKSILIALISSTLGSGGATVLGRTIVSNLMKFIPGVGTVAGGAISASTAAVITVALGSAYIGLMEAVFKGEMDLEDISTKKGKKALAQAFKDKLKEGKDLLNFVKRDGQDKN